MLFNNPTQKQLPTTAPPSGKNEDISDWVRYFHSREGLREKMALTAFWSGTKHESRQLAGSKEGKWYKTWSIVDGNAFVLL